MATYKGVLEQKTGDNTSDILYPKTSADQVENLTSVCLPKTTYEWNKTLALGSAGKVCIGKFGCYDTNITIELRSTTSTTYNATIMIATQNIKKNTRGGTAVVNVYGDTLNSITGLLKVFKPHGSADRKVEVYANLPTYSKNYVHIIQACSSQNEGAETTDVLTQVASIPTEVEDKTVVTPVNTLRNNCTVYNATLLGTNPASYYLNYNNLTNAPDVNDATLTITQNGTSKGTFTANASSDVTIEVSDTTYSSQTAAEGGTAESLVTTGEKYTWNNKSDFSGSYNDLSNKPTIPTALSDLTDDENHRLVTDTQITTWNGKQNALTFDTAPTENSSNPVTSDGIYDAIEEIREVAEGKTATYVIDYADNPMFNSQSQIISSTTNLVDVNDVSIPITDLKVGDNVYVTELDVPDRWVSNIKNSGWVQLFQNGNFVSNSIWAGRLGTLTIDNNEATFLGDSSSNNQKGLYSTIAETVIVGHKYLLMFQAKASTNITVIASNNWSTNQGIWYGCNLTTTYQQFSTFWNNSAQTTLTFTLRWLSDNQGNSYTVKNLQIFDLTTMYGEGNEPSTFEAFKTDYPNDFYTYSTTVGGKEAVYSILETAKVPVNDVQINGTSIVSNNVANITNMATTNTEQTITNVKTFTSGPILNNAIYLQGKNSNGVAKNLIGLDASNNIRIGNGNGDLNEIVVWDTIRTGSGFDVDLGTSSYMFRNLYLKGNMSDGTHTYTLPSDDGTLALTKDIPTYENKTPAQGGTAVSLVTTGDKYNWNNKSDFSGAYADLTGKPTIDTEISTSSTNAVENKGIQLYVNSRGQNLLTNGTFLYGSNYNFTHTGFGSYDGSDTYYCGGCMSRVGKPSTSPSTTEFIPINPANRYILDYYVKCSDPDVIHYDFIDMYDIDKKKIEDFYVYFVAGSLTTLAQDIHDGDTVIHLTSVAGFQRSATASYKRGFIFWDYKNSYGYQYPPETYSRYYYSNFYAGESSFDTVNNTITLSKAWSYGTRPAGTYLSQCSSGASFVYLNAAYTLPANTWTNKRGRLSGVGINGEAGKFRAGTAFVKVGFMPNYSNRSASAGDRDTATWKVSNLSFGIDDHVNDVRVNGSSVVATTNGVASITVPTALSSLTDDTGHRLVTDNQISTWNAKSDFSGSYNDLTNVPTITSLLQTISGYDSTKRQTLRNINGTISWITEMPERGDIIFLNLDGTQREYRIINKVSPTIFEVIGLFTIGSTKFGSTKDYEGSLLDTLLNTTWYDTLTAEAKAAIIGKTFRQDSWQWSAGAYSGYYGPTAPGTTAYTIGLYSTTYGNEITRNVYALSVADIVNYVTDTTLGDGLLQNYNVWKMLFNQTSRPDSNHYWLRSAHATASGYAWGVWNEGGYVNRDGQVASNTFYVRPALQIDLTAITWH